MPSPVNFEKLVRQMAPVATPADQREDVATLSKLFSHTHSPSPSVSSGYKLVTPSGEQTDIPPSVFVLLSRLIEVLDRGDAIALVPVGKELTTQQAAQILNVSRQYVVRLLEDKKIPFYRAGTHRRIRMEDLLLYKKRRDSERMSALDELSQLSQQLGGYDEISKG